MDITRILEADHRETEQVLDKIGRAKGEARRPLVEALQESLRKHLAVEEKVVYPAVAQVAGHEAFVESHGCSHASKHIQCASICQSLAKHRRTGTVIGSRPRLRSQPLKHARS